MFGGSGGTGFGGFGQQNQQNQQGQQPAQGGGLFGAPQQPASTTGFGFNSIPLRRAYSPSLLSQASADSPLRSALLLKQEDSLDSPPSSSSSQLSLQADSLLVRVQILLPVHSDSKLKQSRPALVDSGRVQVRHLLLEMALVDLEHRNSLLLLPLAVVRQPLAPSQLEVSSVSQQRRHLDNRNNRLVDCLESLR
jgi:hypothetical protein